PRRSTRSSWSTCWRTAPATGRPTTAPALRLQARSYRGHGRRLDIGPANMRTYLLLKERAAVFRADPEVQAALAASRVPDLSIPTLRDGESYDDLLADRSSYEDLDVAAAAARGLGAVEQVLGVRRGPLYRDIR